MAVIDFYEPWDGDADGNEDQIGVITYTRTFQLQTDSALDTQATVLAYHELPAKWSQHPGNPALTARKIQATRLRESPLFWRVDVEYSNAIIPISNSDFNNQNQPFNPLDREAKISWGSAQFQEPINYDIDNNPIWNSAFDFYEGITRDQSRPIVTIIKNMINVPPWVMQYHDALNSDSFTLDGITIEPLQAKCQSVKVSEKLREGLFQYRKVTVEIHLRRDVLASVNSSQAGNLSGWTLLLIDEGFRKLVPKRNTTDGAVIPGRYEWENIRVDDQSTTKPVLLDGESGKLHPSLVSGMPEPGTLIEPFYLGFNIYEELPFADIMAALGITG